MSVHGDLTRDKYFTGIEVENTPTYGSETLFIVGQPDINEIEEKLEGTTINCLYFGANMSFKINPDQSAADEWEPWERGIKHFLQKGFWCTLDLDIKYAEDMLESFMVEHRKFIPMISAKLPYINQLGYNAILKIDDKGFDKTNPGVWCHRIHDLMDHSVFTYWDEYEDDAPA